MKKPTKAALTVDPSWADAPWGTVEAFVHMYNYAAPESWPAVELVTFERAVKIKEYLAIFPPQKFWETVYRNAVKSKFLSETYGYASMDWLLQKGHKDQVHNCLKTFEGKYNGPTQK